MHCNANVISSHGFNEQRNTHRMVGVLCASCYAYMREEKKTHVNSLREAVSERDIQDAGVHKSEADNQCTRHIHPSQLKSVAE